ncbi:MAG: glycosyl hydrolase family 65 protein, partial [Eubacteriales bacterium]|nr:glycosyl hydrolase family 65 protein [Eubacteriales bacterium]
NLRRGVLTQTWQTKRAAVRMERMVSMADSQLMVQRIHLTAKRAGAFTVEAVADADVCNLPVSDDQTVTATERVKLLETVALTETAMRLRAVAEGTEVEIGWQITTDREAGRESRVTRRAAVTRLTANLAAGESWTVEKRVRILADGETPHSNAADPWQAHEAALAALWEDCDLQVDADDASLQGALRYNIYQLLCNRAGRGCSIGARGLTHGRYKGNTFWDTEVFMLPFFLWSQPEAAKNLLLYRADRLADAEALAKKQNLEGARFPWMCAKSGAEQCESWDIGLCEVHITADIVYAMQRYVETTGDTAFLKNTAAEVYRQTALYWLSRMTYEPEKDQYSLFFVKGPDEYCGATVNNTFTNYLARYNLQLALRYGNLTPAERERMEHAKSRIPILYDEKRELFRQDELLERLQEPDFPVGGDEPSYKKFCFDRMQRYRVLKQADLVLLMNLFPADFTDRQKRNVFAYYEPITLHDSTLSYGAHAQLALQLGLWQKAETYLRKAVYLDLRDVMGNTGHEGLHMAALGAAWQAVVYGAAGLWLNGDQPAVKPMLPPSIHGLRFRVRVRGKRYAVAVTPDGGTIREED